MVFLRLKKENDKKGKVTLIHNFQEQLSEEDKRDGVLIEKYEEPVVKGKIVIPYWNYEKNALEFEYKDIPESNEELFKRRITMLELALADLVGK